MSIDGENLFDEVEDEMKNVAEDAAEEGAYRAGRRFLDYSKRKHANKKGKGKSTTGNGASTSAGKGAAGGSAGAAAEAGTGAGGATSGASSVAEGAAGDAAAKEPLPLQEHQLEELLPEELLELRQVRERLL